MSKLGKKLMIWVAFIIVILGSLSIIVNSQLVERYYLKAKETQLLEPYQQIKESDQESLDQVIKAINGQEDFFAVSVYWSNSIEIFNDALRNALELERINIDRLWIWDSFFEQLQNGEEVTRVYNQGKFKYSLLLKLIPKGDQVVALIQIIPHATEIIEIINHFTVAVWILSLVGMLGVIIFFIQRLTKPLIATKKAAEEIANLHFSRIQVDTNDELEELAVSMNKMSECLEEAHQALEAKNMHMKQLLSDVSHELKTPIALIKAYGAGIQDQLDDGTFLGVIMEQNERMASMVNKLLEMCRMEREHGQLEQVDMSQMLHRIIEEQSVALEQMQLIVELDIENDRQVWMNKEALMCILTNLITNGMKYTNDRTIHLQLIERAGDVCFQISNGVAPTMAEQLDVIWQPFYAGEASRNKDLCGTGLGLYIVQQLLEKYKIPYRVWVEEEKIYFELIFHNL